MRVILDVNVLLRAVLGSALAAKLLERTAISDFDLLTCDLLNEELAATVRKSRLAELVDWDAYNRLISFLTIAAERVVPIEPFPQCRDPKDNYLLAMARDGAADFLVTRDNDLLCLNRFGTCEIIRPEEFVGRFGTLNNPDAAI